LNKAKSKQLIEEGGGRVFIDRPCAQVGPVKDVMSQSHMRELQSWMQTPPFSHVVALHCCAVPAINVQCNTGFTFRPKKFSQQI